jgi:thiamine pyrophosphate-dependent acetolactate synthase large subunit-like protein
MAVRGNQLVAQALKARGVETIFFLMGGPMIDAANACEEAGIRMIDVRHEQAAVMMAHAHSRLTNKPTVCMAASGPGTANYSTGLANAYLDRAPVLALGGSSELASQGRGAFQEMDQWGMMKPVVRWSARANETWRIPELIENAFRNATATGTGPVYLDLPGDVLYGEVEEEDVRRIEPQVERARPQADAAEIERALDLLAAAERPVAVSGSGLFWSDATDQYRQWIDRAGIPFFTTPIARGAIPEDHELLFAGVRSKAFREADLILLVGTRMNYVVDYVGPPRFAAAAKLIQIDIDEAEVGRTRHADAALVGDARAVLQQLLSRAEGRLDSDRYKPWVDSLRTANEEKADKREESMSTGAVPIHPLRLCKEVRDFMDRDAILSVDGQEILNFGRQAIPTFVPRHRLNSGPLGTMGVGLPFGIGAKAAKPDTQVIVVHGDGSMGLNAMELDTAVRHDLPVLVVVSNNGGWTAATRFKSGRELGYTRFDKIGEALGCHGEHVEDPDEIRPALERAAASGRTAVVNVVTDAAAAAVTVEFTRYKT